MTIGLFLTVDLLLGQNLPLRNNQNGLSGKSVNEENYVDLLNMDMNEIVAEEIFCEQGDEILATVMEQAVAYLGNVNINELSPDINMT